MTLTTNVFVAGVNQVMPGAAHLHTNKSKARLGSQTKALPGERASSSHALARMNVSANESRLISSGRRELAPRREPYRSLELLRELRHPWSVLLRELRHPWSVLLQVPRPSLVRQQLEPCQRRLRQQRPLPS